MQRYFLEPTGMINPEFTDLPEPLEAFGARTAIVLGSGLDSFVDSLSIDGVVPYATIPGLPTSSVPGHEGTFALARVHGNPLLIARGRVHLYEGWNAQAVTAAVRLMHRVGVTRVILTNAAGALNPTFQLGQWMQITDHLNLTGQSPLDGGPHFVDLTAAYDERLRRIFLQAAVESGVPLAEGIYASLPGPQYETPAEVRMLRTLGADAVGMSTVLETIQARALGLEVTAFSCLTNWAAGITGDLLDHAEVTATGHRAAGDFATLVSQALPHFATR